MALVHETSLKFARGTAEYDIAFNPNSGNIQQGTLRNNYGLDITGDKLIIKPPPTTWNQGYWSGDPNTYQHLSRWKWLVDDFFDNYPGAETNSMTTFLNWYIVVDIQEDKNFWVPYGVGNVSENAGVYEVIRITNEPYSYAQSTGDPIQGGVVGAPTEFITSDSHIIAPWFATQEEDTNQVPMWKELHLERGLYETEIRNWNALAYQGTPPRVRIYNDIPDFITSTEQEAQELLDQIEEESYNIHDVTPYSQANEEDISTEFGVDGVNIQQTLLNPLDPYSGMDIDTGSFQYTNQGLENSNRDGRIELGMFSFEDDNVADNDFQNTLGPPFMGLTKTNLVKNGDCKFVESNLLEVYDPVLQNDLPRVIQPQGDWQYLSLWGVDSAAWEGGTDNITEGLFDPGVIQSWDDTDSQGDSGYGGRYTYVPLSLELADNTQGSGEDYGSVGDIVAYGRYKYWHNMKYAFDSRYAGQEDTLNDIWTMFLDGPSQDDIFQQFFTQENSAGSWRAYREVGYHCNQDTSFPEYVDHPLIAHWLITDEAYSENRCLCFVNYDIWSTERQVEWVTPAIQDNGNVTPFIWNWLNKDNHSDHLIESDTIANDTDNYFTNHQYRVLNQTQKIYDKFNDNALTPYSSLKIRFKMKTTAVIPPSNVFEENFPSDSIGYEFEENPLSDNLGWAPEVEVGILTSQFEETPLSGLLGLAGVDFQQFNQTGETYPIGTDRFLLPAGGFNSTKYPNAETFTDKQFSDLGGMTRFKNSVMNEWETFEFDFNLTEEHNNKGMIYGVPYGGSFFDEDNGGSIEIMINHSVNAADNSPAGDHPGIIYFKIPGYQDPIPPVDWKMISPQGNVETFRHGERLTFGYNTVVSGLGNPNASVTTHTGLDKESGRRIEAYLMYVDDDTADTMVITNSDFEYGTTNTSDIDIAVVYWDGERWSFDGGHGYQTNIASNTTFTFYPDPEKCFILARLYTDKSGDGEGIAGIDQYISNDSEFSKTGVGNLHLFLQSGNNFNGRVLIDDIECFESYEFTPEVDVRKKISTGAYGKADLTNYYDKELHPDEYEDSKAPLEVQFYFYPQYPTTETFIERTPIYQDFKLGRFYIYDIDWGDGSPSEFTGEPKQIDENVALYHTYETHGIFEITGTMLRVKVDDSGEILGVAHNKRFKLRIHINKGADEDFQYFGSDGFSFIPYKNTSPIIGGISEQSSYYKKIKRQLGFIGDEKISIEFKNKSDKLKTELALVNMENQSDSNLEVLPAYEISRSVFIPPEYPQEPMVFTPGDNIITWPYPDIFLDQIPHFAPHSNYTEYSDLFGEIEPEWQNYPLGEQPPVTEHLIGAAANAIDYIESLSWNTPESVILGGPEGLDYTTPLWYQRADSNSEENGGYCARYYWMDYNQSGTMDWNEGLYFSNWTLLSAPHMEFGGDPRGIIRQGYMYNFHIRDGAPDFEWDGTTNHTMTQEEPFVTQEITPGEFITIYNGLKINREELGRGIGNTDLTNIKYYNTPKSIWELLGFEDESLEQISTPNNPRYWKNIIPKSQPFFHRAGLADFIGISPSLETLNKYDTSEATTTFENSPLGDVESGTPPNVDGWSGNNFDKRFGVCTISEGDVGGNTTQDACEALGGNFEKNWSMEIVDIDDLPGYQKAIRVVTKYDENSQYTGKSWGGFYRTFDPQTDPPTMFAGWFKVLKGGMEFGALNTTNHINKPPDYGNPDNGWEFFVSPLSEAEGWTGSGNSGCHYYSEVNADNPDGEVLIAGLFSFTNEEFYTGLYNAIETGEEQDYKLGLNSYKFTDTINIHSEQEWFGNYYYPVLPKYGIDGRFIENNYTNDNLPFPLEGQITDENESNENLLINTSIEKIEVDVLDDNSGNKNYSFAIGDFSPKFDDETLRVEKTKKRNVIKNTKKDGAF